jgi:hypothetical protein
MSSDSSLLDFEPEFELESIQKESGSSLDIAMLEL